MTAMIMKAMGAKKGEDTDEEHRNGCRDDDIHDAPPGKGDEQEDDSCDGDDFKITGHHIDENIKPGKE